MKARRFIAEAKSPSWRALPGNAFRLEHRGLNPLRTSAHRGPGTPAGGKEDSQSGKWGRGQRVSGSRWADIPQGPTHQGSRRRGPLPAEVRLDISTELSSLWASQHRPGAAGVLLPGEAGGSAGCPNPSSESSPLPAYTLWRIDPQQNGPPSLSNPLLTWPHSALG